MAPQSTEPIFLRKILIEVPVCHGSKQAIEVPTYISSNRLHVWEDALNFKEDVTDSKEDVTDSKEDVTDSKEDATDLKEDELRFAGLTLMEVIHRDHYREFPEAKLYYYYPKEDIPDSKEDVADSKEDVTDSKEDATDLKEDEPRFAGLTLMEYKHYRQMLEAKLYYYCPILTFRTESPQIVSFALQICFPAENKQIHMQALTEDVETLLHQVKWNGRQVIPTNVNNRKADLPDHEVEAKIGEKDEKEIRKWKNQTFKNITTAFDRQQEAAREYSRSTNQTITVWKRNIISRIG
ncbi:hypothetical protein FAGAP_8342 [Fusarium agapanthi]|uniref:Uncharacterized protein n=1 Tax=Fusarium agapanthi TaxID=1803897 RepID=A0A9P5B791_9HYPO|nr:hypothetical protein FAGAP_8342 [Fusarium agapanthi]